MPLISWSKEYELNIAEIDNQHKKLFEIANSILHAIRSVEYDKKHIDAILKELVEYTKYHFATEERYMAEHHYVHYSQHVEYHERLVGELSEFLIENNSNEQFNVLNLLKFIKSWLIDHILHEDKKITDLLSHSKACHKSY